jgi:phage terminase large subunit GpA-like protein
MRFNQLFARSARLGRPVIKTTPDAWARANRTYGSSTGHPNPRDPGLTPYVIPVARAIASRRWRRVVLCCSAQSGKTELLLDVIGQRLDQAPCPVIYVAPSRQIATERFEPRIMQLLDEAPSLADKVARGKRMSKTRKVVSGVPLFLAHGGSSSALKSESIGLAVTDEVDELAANIKHQGDPIGLIDRRGDAFADFVHACTSTPSAGLAEIITDPESGLAFWGPNSDTDSKIWDLFQAGTRCHWTWPCLQCGSYYIPRFSCLDLKNAAVICPKCGGTASTEKDKAEMNKRGVFIAPGQSVGPDGTVRGDVPESTTASFWVSGLCSPFRTFGERANEYQDAQNSGDMHSVQTVVNASFGELWAPTAADALPWEEVAKLRLATYSMGAVPAGAVYLTCGVDTQGNRLVYVIRAWGARQESWLIEAGELWGETALDHVWTDLADLLAKRWGGLYIRRCFIDAGFRPGKKDTTPEHMVYNFCRRHHRQCFASKGFDRRDAPLSVKRIDVDLKGRSSKFGLDLVRLDTDFLKSWVHQRLRWPSDQPGGWHLPSDATEAYCKQIVSEARVRKQGGGYTWVQTSRDNHFLDAESLAYAAAFMLGVTRMTDDKAKYILAEREREGLTASDDDGVNKEKPEPKFAQDTWFGASPGSLRFSNQREGW